MSSSCRNKYFVNWKTVLRLVALGRDGTDLAELVQLRAELHQALEELSQQREQAGGLEETLRQSRHDSDRLRSLVAELSSKCAQLQVSLS